MREGPKGKKFEVIGRPVDKAFSLEGPGGKAFLFKNGDGEPDQKTQKAP
jgi:hypothetical protein